MESCTICCETYTPAMRKPVACPQCQHTACAACVRRYLLTTNELACMACRKPWERANLVGVLPKSFVHIGLTKWRKDVLFEREMGMMPATVPLVAAKRAMRALQPQLFPARHAARMARNALSTAMAELRHRRQNMAEPIPLEDGGDMRTQVLLERLAAHGPPYVPGTPFTTYHTEYNRHTQQLEHAYNNLETYLTYASRSIYQGAAPISWEEYQANVAEAFDENATVGPPRESTRYVPTYIRPCPVADCRGFLSAETYTCGVCEAKVCKDCHELLDKGAKEAEARPHANAAAEAEAKPHANAAAEAEARPHVCHPDNVASAKMILKDTRPCPKCAVRIHKIDGCDQMWCPSCHTAFSWRTGDIETKRVHNPHYYEWMRNHHGSVPREPGDVPGGGPDGPCDDNLPGYYDVIQWITRIIPYTGAMRRVRNFYDVEENQDDRSLGDFVCSMHRLMIHCNQYELPYYRTQDRHLQNHDLRISYLEKTINKADFQKELHKREKKHNKNTAVHQVVEMFVNVMSDLFRNHMRTSNRAALEALRDEATALIAYTNTCFSNVAAQYNNVTPRIMLGMRRYHDFVRWGRD